MDTLRQYFCYQSGSLPNALKNQLTCLLSSEIPPQIFISFLDNTNWCLYYFLLTEAVFVKQNYDNVCVEIELFGADWYKQDLSILICGDTRETI
jgi:hypothetical protein